nr:carbamoyltransferase C-terminal domain-containing protein [uncultured Acetatifactor sp.]
MKGSYLGPSYDRKQIMEFLISNRYKYYDYYEEPEKMYEKVADYLCEDKVIGLFQGRMEYGPRALGNRSIIANPMSKEMQSKLNQKIKFRESFRPFAPSVLAEESQEYFKLDCESPYMLLVAEVKDELRILANGTESCDYERMDLTDRVRQCRSQIPAVTHVDYTARVQTVLEETNYDYYHIIKAFKEVTGCACIVNTSFNVRGEPIVCSPQDAYLCFMRTDMDILVMGKCILVKDEQEEIVEKREWRNEYELD